MTVAEVEELKRSHISL